MQDGNGTISWKDAELTPHGISQTGEANRFWRETAVQLKVPFPEIHYVSSMRRTMQTANFTWASNPNFATKSKGFFAKETIREGFDACTCSNRHPKSFIAATFPMMKLDADMPEEDALWHAGKGEPESNMKARSKEFLQTVFDGPETIVSGTSHGWIIRILLGVIKYPNPNFDMQTAQNIPLLIRGDKVSGKLEKAQAEGYTEVKTCPKCEASTKL
jgi:broad specificity phosphatase PhoE